MRHKIKSLFILLVTLGFILSCAHVPQQVAKKTLELTQDSTVSLVSQNGNQLHLGSGFFVDKNKIATNIHIVGQPGPIFAKLSKKGKNLVFAIEGVTAFDVKNNLAILKLSGESTPLPLGDSDMVKIGESVSVVDYPNGRSKAKSGTIDSILRSNQWFWMKIATPEQSSGGPVLNSKGKVIGISVGYGDDSHNYVIPSNALKVLIAKTMPLEPLLEWQKRKHIRAEVHHSQGEQKFAAEQYKNAIVDFDKVIELNPEHVRSYYKRGNTKIKLKNYESAIDDYTHAIKINPKYIKAFNNRGLAKCKYGDIVSERGDAENAEWLYHEGIVDICESIQLRYMADTDAQIVPKESQKGIRSIVSILNWSGSLNLGSGFFVDTDTIVTNIHNIDSPGPVYAKLINNETIWKVEEVIAFDVKNDLVILKLPGEGIPLLLGDSDEVQKGIPVVSVGYPNKKYKATKGKVDNIRNRDKWIVTTANCFGGNSGGPLLNSKGEIIGINTAATESGDYCISVPSNILKALLNQSVSPEPLVQWQKRDPIKAYAYYGMGEKNCIAGNYNKALINFEKAILHYPKHFDIYNWSGWAKHNLGKSKESQGGVVEAQKLFIAAIDDYTQTIKLDPENASTYSNRGNVKYDLGESKAEQGDTAEAQKLFIAAIDDYTYSIKLNPSNADSFLNRASAKYFLGKTKTELGIVVKAQKLYNAAIQDYTNAININPKDVSAYKYRGIVRKALGQPDEAEKDFEKGKKLESKK